MKSKILLIGTLVMSLMFMSVNPSMENESAEMTRFWGSETSTQTACNADCCTVTTYSTYYVFWVAVDVEVVDVQVTCTDEIIDAFINF